MDDNIKTIEDINRYCSPLSLLVIDKQGQLHRIYCPFQVIVIRKIPIAEVNSRLMVDAVRLSTELLMLYVIKKTAYPYHYFWIIL